MLDEFHEARENIELFSLQQTLYKRGNRDDNGRSIIQALPKSKFYPPIPTLSRINVLKESRFLEIAFHGLRYEPLSTMFASHTCS